jgi:beta-mannosidase
MHTIDLTGQWEIIERPLDDGPDARPKVEKEPAELTGAVPGDVNDALVRAGRMPEPLEGRNFEEFRWVQQRSWWFRKTFQISREVADRDQVDLLLDGLDVHADIWLNGVHLGHHRSVFHPFETEVSGRLQADRDNVLLVRPTTGRERVPEEPNFPLVNRYQ